MINKIATLVVVSTIAAFAATSVYAGFEWVPPGGTGNNAAGSIISSPSAATPADSAPLLPVMSQELDQPLELPAPPAAPAPKVAPVASGNAPAQILQAPPSAAPMTPEPTPVLKVKTVSAPAPVQNKKPAAMEAEPMPLLPEDAPAKPTPVTAAKTTDEAISWNPAPAQAPAKKTEPVKLAPAKVVVAAPEVQDEEPPMMNMPDSAPVSRKIVINPYPTKQPSKAPAATAEAAPTQAADVAPASGDFAAVDSFGSDMPLAIGLQQIAPPGYVLAFGSNVNPGITISWEGGGKPWNDVIQQAIAPHQLTSRVEGKKIYIKHLSAANIEAISPEAGSEEASAPQKKTEQLALADSSARRSNVTDPGEAPQIQPISTPVVDAPAKEEAPKAAAPAAQPAAKKITVRGVWEASKGDSLKNTLDSWSKKANVDLVWSATHDFTIASDFSINDSFEAAVTGIVTNGMKDDKPVVSIDDTAKNGKKGSVTVADAL